MKADYFADLLASVPGVPTTSPPEWGHSKARNDGNVPGVPSVPASNSNTGDMLSDGLLHVAEEDDADAREYFNERAAIAEHDGGLSADQAERQAAQRIYEYQLAERPGRWLVMLARFGDELAAVERSLKDRFGADRVLAVRQYVPERIYHSMEATHES